MSPLMLNAAVFILGTQNAAITERAQQMNEYLCTCWSSTRTILGDWSYVSSNFIPQIFFIFHESMYEAKILRILVNNIYHHKKYGDSKISIWADVFFCFFFVEKKWLFVFLSHLWNASRIVQTLWRLTYMKYSANF